MNSHMKSTKHVKMNRTSFVSQHFFKGLQQKRENRNAVKSEFWAKNVLYTMLSCLLPYFLILEKKVCFLIFVQNANYS